MMPFVHSTVRLDALKRIAYRVGRSGIAVLFGALWIFGVHWGYTHAIQLRTQRREAQAQAVIHARDMQHMRDLQQLRECQMRVLESYDYQQTDLMIAQSALKHAGMER